MFSKLRSDCYCLAAGRKLPLDVALFLTLLLENRGRQREGSIRFKVDIGPTVSSAADTGRLGVDEQLITRLLQKAIRNTGVVDLEALCVSAGRKVWQTALQLEFKCLCQHVWLSPKKLHIQSSKLCQSLRSVSYAPHGLRPS